MSSDSETPPVSDNAAVESASSSSSAAPAAAAPARKPLSALLAGAAPFDFEFEPTPASSVPSETKVADSVDAITASVAALGISSSPSTSALTTTAAPSASSSNSSSSSSSSSSNSSSSSSCAAVGGEDDAEGGEDDEEAAGAVARAAAIAEDPRDHFNVVFIGHVDAGKSTLSGSILMHTGKIDKRDIEKFERDAKAKGRESWWLAFILDTTDEERNKGITVEVGRATFETPKRRYTILDAPGHKNYVPNMIAGAAQADVGVLVISARKGEFETGFEKGGQTMEHATLAKVLGVRYLVVVVNKMDEPTVKWSKERYDEIVSKLSPFLRSNGYNLAKHVHFIPISGISGANIKDRTSKAVCPWYDGPSLLELLDSLTMPGRDPSGPLRIPVLDKYQDSGLIVMGKVEGGTAREGQKIMLFPMRQEATIHTLYINDVEVKTAKPGENVKLKLKGCKDEDVARGFVIGEADRPIIPVKQFECQLQVMELDAHSLFTAGYSAVLHVHTAQEEVSVKKLVAELNPKGEPMPGPAPRFIKSGKLCTAVLEVAQALCVEKYETMPQLGRFTLRDGQRTIAVGKILRLGIPKSQQDAYKKAVSASAASSNSSSSSSSGGV